MTSAHINQIATSVPENDVHKDFVNYACRQLASDDRSARLFQRLSDLGGIDHRFSFMKAAADPSSGKVDQDGIYVQGNFPGTGTRMALFEKFAPALAAKAVEGLELGASRAKVTHLIVTCCTGFSAPGLDLQLLEVCGLATSVERTVVGFMGCYAAMNALKLARHVVRSEPASKVLVLNLELCTLHLKETSDLEQMLSFFLFGDGCSAALVSSEAQGVSMDSFHAVLAPNTESLITWNIGDSGFDMVLSGQVPGSIRDALRCQISTILGGASPSEIDLWAVHPGGRSVLDAVQVGIDLPADALWASRGVLRRYGNMSSPSVMFVLKDLMEAAKPGQRGCGMAFGPGLVAETMQFHVAG